MEVKVPDIGDFTDVPVIEILVAPGDEVAPEDALITLESDKATMDVPSPEAGVVKELSVEVGDTVSMGSLILMLEGAAAEADGSEDGKAPAAAEAPPAPESEPAPDADVQADVVVLGAGPGGYTAAFRAADLGLKTVLVERHERLGGVCLNVGCIPSKSLLHIARVLSDVEESASYGITFGEPEIDVEKLRGWKDSVVEKLTGGLTGLAKQRKVEVVRGTGTFTSPNLLSVEGEDGTTSIGFKHCIIAAGSSPTVLPGMPEDDPRLMDSTGALELVDIPERLLVIGGGIIGLEMATVFAALGVKVSVVELTPGLMPGCDADLVRPLQKRIASRYEHIWLDTKVVGIEPRSAGLEVLFEGAKAPPPQVYDKVLVAVGRTPNGKTIAAEAAGVNVDARGYIAVDRQMRTNVAHIYAIGDIVGQPMLAHKATHEGKVAAEVIAGHKSSFDARVIPSVAYTDPEIAWVGLTETAAKAAGTAYEKSVFPWAASGRSLAMGRDEGFTKLLFDPGNHRVVGGGIVGPHAGDLISEVALAIEMGCDAADIGLTIHPHPTLSETVAMAAEAFEGTLTDLYLPKKKR